MVVLSDFIAIADNALVCRVIGFPAFLDRRGNPKFYVGPIFAELGSRYVAWQCLPDGAQAVS